MRRLYPILTVLALLLTLATIPASAGVPAEATVQGRLLDSAGAPVAAGPKIFTFRLYDAEFAGTLIWEETQFLGTDDNGVWTANLGDITPLSDAEFNGLSRWLEVEYDDSVNPAETFSRVKMTSSPFAYRISTVDGSTGGIISGDVSIQSNLDVAGNVGVQDDLTVGANALVTGNAAVSGLLDVSGDVTGSTITAGTVNATTGYGFPDASTQVTAAFNVPVGAIIAWNKDLAGTPALPANFVECDGALINDVASPYNGLNAPNLNASGRFLQGGAASQLSGGAPTHSHPHNHTTGSHSHGISSTTDGTSLGSGIRHISNSNPIFGSGTLTTNTNAVSTSNLPPYFTVVWIMRVR